LLLVAFAGLMSLVYLYHSGQKMIFKHIMAVWLELIMLKALLQIWQQQGKGVNLQNSEGDYFRRELCWPCCFIVRESTYFFNVCFRRLLRWDMFWQLMQFRMSLVLEIFTYFGFGHQTFFVFQLHPCKFY